MKISRKVYLLITNTFILWNPHWPPQQPQSEAGLSCKQEWWPPCQFWPLQPWSWHWGRPGCYEGVHWPLSQLRSTWNDLKDYHLLSWEARFHLTKVLQVGLQPVLGDFGCVLGGLATKYIVLVRPNGLFCFNFELGGQIFLDSGPSVWVSASPGWFWLCFGWSGHKIHCPCEAKRTFFVLILNRNGICLPSILVLV